MTLSLPAVHAHGLEAVSVVPNVAAPEETVNLTGTQFPATTEIAFTMRRLSGDIALGSVIADAAGSFEFSAQVPTTAEPGYYALSSTSRSEIVLVDFTVSGRRSTVAMIVGIITATLLVGGLVLIRFRPRSRV